MSAAESIVEAWAAWYNLGSVKSGMWLYRRVLVLGIVAKRHIVQTHQYVHQYRR